MAALEAQQGRTVEGEIPCPGPVRAYEKASRRCLGVDRAHDEANALLEFLGSPARARVAVCSSSGGAVAGDFRGSEKIFLIGAKEAESRA